MATIKQNAGLTVDSRDMDAVLRAFKRLDREGNKAARVAVQEMTEGHASALRSAAAGSSDPRARSVGPTIRPVKDRFPTIAVGGAKRLNHRGNPRAGDVVFGTEFGAGGPNAWRFPDTNRDGYWLMPALRARHRDIVNEWLTVVDAVVKEWGRD